MKPSDSATESALLKRVDHGLEIAVREAGLNWQDGYNLTKREKYKFFAVNDLSDGTLPVTYSWYRYGISSIARQVNRPLPISDDDIILEMDEGEIADYYLTEHKKMPLEIWWPNSVTVLDFLSEYYIRCCPSALKEIYLANIEIRKAVENGILATIEDSGIAPRDDYENIRDQLLKIQVELASDQGRPVFEEDITLDAVYEDFITFSDVLEDAILAATHRENLSDTGPEYQAITKLKNVFDGTVWPYITCIISARTGVGPNSHRVEGLAEGNFNRISSDFEQELNAAENQCQKASLYTSFDEYDVAETTTSSKIDDLMDIVDGNVDHTDGH